MIQKNNVWKYNNHEFEIDFADADTFEKYWDACDKLGERETELKNANPDRGFMRRYCAMFFEFFDNAIGEGTSKKLFGDRCNTQACEIAYDDFITFAGEQVKEVNASRMNRAQGRNAAKKGDNRSSYRHDYKKR